MIKRSAPTIFALLFVSLLSIVSTEIEAQEARDDLTEETRQKASQLLKEADEAFQRGDYQTALQGYQEAYQLSPRAELLFNMAQCYRLLSWPEEAVSYYQRFLLEAPDTSLRADIEALIREMSPTSAPISMPVTPPAEEKGFPVLYGVSGVSLGLGLVSGGIALASGLKAKQIAAQENPSINAFQKNSRRARTLGIAADVFLGAAVISGGAGFLLHRSKTPEDLKVSILPAGVSISVRF